MPSGIAAAVGAPALDSMHAAPGTVLDNFGDVVRGMALEKLTIVRKHREVIRLNMMQSIGQRHFSKTVVMAIAFSVGCDVHELRPFPRVGKPAEQAVGKTSPVIE